VGDRTDRGEIMYADTYIFSPLSVRSPTYTPEYLRITGVGIRGGVLMSWVSNHS